MRAVDGDVLGGQAVTAVQELRHNLRKEQWIWLYLAARFYQILSALQLAKLHIASRPYALDPPLIIRAVCWDPSRHPEPEFSRLNRNQRLIPTPCYPASY